LKHSVDIDKALLDALPLLSGRRVNLRVELRCALCTQAHIRTQRLVNLSMRLRRADAAVVETRTEHARSRARVHFLEIFRDYEFKNVPCRNIAAV
jgi:hypothetical protein